MMITELEQKFYDTFGIKPYFKYLLVDTQARKKKEHLFDKTELIEFCTTHKDFILLKVVKKYPDITAEKLLEMICILSAYNYIFEDLKADNTEQLKEEIIKLFFDYPLIVEEEKTNIQQLFKVDDTHKSTMLNIITDDEY